MSSDNVDRLFRDLKDSLDVWEQNSIWQQKINHKTKRSTMIRNVIMAVLLSGAGFGAASVDWQSKSDAVSEWWNAPPSPGRYTYGSGDFQYWKQCTGCYDIFYNMNVTSCKSCGDKVTETVHARLLDGETDPHRADGYQTKDGTLYVFPRKQRYFDWEKFFIGDDLYSKEEIIPARKVKLR